MHVKKKKKKKKNACRYLIPKELTTLGRWQKKLWLWSRWEWAIWIIAALNNTYSYGAFKTRSSYSLLPCRMHLKPLICHIYSFHHSFYLGRRPTRINHHLSIKNMSGPQCCKNPPTLDPTAGVGSVVKLGGLNSYVTGASTSNLAILLVSDVFGRSFSKTNTLCQFGFVDLHLFVQVKLRTMKQDYSSCFAGYEAPNFRYPHFFSSCMQILKLCMFFC